MNISDSDIIRVKKAFNMQIQTLQKEYTEKHHPKFSDSNLYETIRSPYLPSGRMIDAMKWAHIGKRYRAIKSNFRDDKVRKSNSEINKIQSCSSKTKKSVLTLPQSLSSSYQQIYSSKYSLKSMDSKQSTKTKVKECYTPISKVLTQPKSPARDNSLVTVKVHQNTEIQPNKENKKHKNFVQRNKMMIKKPDKVKKADAVNKCRNSIVKATGTVSLKTSHCSLKAKMKRDKRRKQKKYSKVQKPKNAEDQSYITNIPSTQTNNASNPNSKSTSSSTITVQERIIEDDKKMCIMNSKEYGRLKLTSKIDDSHNETIQSSDEMEREINDYIINENKRILMETQQKYPDFLNGDFLHDEPPNRSFYDDTSSEMKADKVEPPVRTQIERKPRMITTIPSCNKNQVSYNKLQSPVNNMQANRTQPNIKRKSRHTPSSVNMNHQPRQKNDRTFKPLAPWNNDWNDESKENPAETRPSYSKSKKHTKPISEAQMEELMDILNNRTSRNKQSYSKKTLSTYNKENECNIAEMMAIMNNVGASKIRHPHPSPKTRSRKNDKKFQIKDDVVGKTNNGTIKILYNEESKKQRQPVSRVNLGKRTVTAEQKCPKTNKNDLNKAKTYVGEPAKKTSMIKKNSSKVSFSYNFSITTIEEIKSFWPSSKKLPQKLLERIEKIIYEATNTEKNRLNYEYWNKTIDPNASDIEFINHLEEVLAKNKYQKKGLSKKGSQKEMNPKACKNQPQSQVTVHKKFKDKVVKTIFK